MLPSPPFRFEWYAFDKRFGSLKIDAILIEEGNSSRIAVHPVDGNHAIACEVAIKGNVMVGVR